MKKIKLEIGVLEYIFKTCRPFLACDDTRPVLKSIKIEVAEKEIKAIACDGYSMTVLTFPNNQEVEAFEFCITPFAMPKNVFETEIEVDEKVITICLLLNDGNRITYTQRVILGEYINWQQVMPETSQDLMIALDSRRISKAISAIRNNKNVVLNMSFKGDGSIMKHAPVKLETSIPDFAKVETIVLPLNVR